MAIFTPYLDIPEKTWEIPSLWQRNVDPYLIGFDKDNTFPFFTVVHRWCNGGVFPLVADMISDTMDHIRKHFETIVRLAKSAEVFENGDDTALEKLLADYDEGTMFANLRLK